MRWPKTRQKPRRAAPKTTSSAFEAPERGSADELLDARRPRAASTRCATARRTSWPRPSSTCSRARSWASAPPSTTASTTTSSCRAPLTPDDLARDRGADGARASRPTTRSCARSCRSTRAGRSSTASGQAFKVEILDDLAREGRGGRRAGAGDDVLRARPVPRPVPRARTSSRRARSARSSCSRSSGAYWRGDQKRPTLQRIYGTVWETQEELDQFLWRREEAKKRDHRKLGVQLDLFSFHDVAPGSRVLAPQGLAPVPARCATRCASSRTRRGYEEIYTPPLVHQKLWEQSGPLGRSTATTCSSSTSRARRSASSR